MSQLMYKGPSRPMTGKRPDRHAVTARQWAR
ncbi:hypothetical protein C8E87_8062 [Paractinoplanes brasiliensis]|uniref:Uncharacterized protein n=1 Tax=Paractinoplanes brasiliensis TaxID=52695 RepID=A0A4R6JDJ4_9ACTN|nr:hypothetical protein C8E87_8062 [Actinoplanes brasiliensis]